MKIDLRDYQGGAFDAARAHIRAGRRRILINAPTGSGKTVLAAAVMEMVKALGNRANFVVDRLSLVDQTSHVFDSYGLDHGVIQSEHPRYRPSLPLQICSIQTLARRGWPGSHVDVFDEAHVLHQAHKDRLAQGGSVVIGLTATPFTKGLGKHFDAVVNVCTTRWLIDQGWLAPYRIFSCTEPDMEGVTVKSTGEWDDKQASSRALEVVGDVVQEYLTHGDGRKFICTAVDTAHVDELARQFRAAGIVVETYTYKDKAEDRSDTVTEFRKPTSTIRGLITVTAASRGFDVPDVSCLIAARPLRKSLAEHIQFFGRGLRISEGKTDCLVLDHSGNFGRFYRDTEDFFDHGVEELDDGKPKTKADKKDKAKEPVKCPSCRALHAPAPSCPVCGHEYPRRQSVQHVPGTLKELLVVAKANPAAQQKLDHMLFPQLVGYALRKREGDAARRYAQALYKGLTGEFARMKFDLVDPVDPSDEVMRRIRAHNIAYVKGREASERRRGA